MVTAYVVGKLYRAAARVGCGVRLLWTISRLHEAGRRAFGGFCGSGTGGTGEEKRDINWKIARFWHRFDPEPPEPGQRGEEPTTGVDDDD